MTLLAEKKGSSRFVMDFPVGNDRTGKNMEKLLEVMKEMQQAKKGSMAHVLALKPVLTCTGSYKFKGNEEPVNLLKKKKREYYHFHIL